MAASAIGASAAVAAPLASGGPARLVGAASGQMQYTPNWSGYVASASVPFRLVSSHWVEPSISCTGSYPESAAFWVGLDGWFAAPAYASNTVEQGGTFADCIGTTPYYFAWWEMWPTNAMVITYQIKAGDAMAASVTYKGGLFTIAVTDQTTKQSYKTVQTCLTCSRRSAEWIAESPYYYGTATYSNLPRWSPAINFYPDQASTKATLTPSYVGTFANFPVTMTGLILSDPRYNRATPTALGPLGRGFHDTWLTEAP